MKRKKFEILKLISPNHPHVVQIVGVKENKKIIKISEKIKFY
jgi:hypothetical protein